MKVVVRIPEREDYEFKGPMRVLDVVQKLAVNDIVRRVTVKP